jgi:hypothetical protein
MIDGSTGASLDFYKNVDITENAQIDKSVDVRAFVHGNVGIANATADAFGPNTVSETLTETHAFQGHGSSAASESLSATNGHEYHILT